MDNSERQAIEENIKITCDMTWLKRDQVEKFLKDWFTHSELRNGVWKWGSFIPWELIDSLKKKKYWIIPWVYVNKTRTIHETIQI